MDQASSIAITTKNYKIRSKFDAKLIAGFIKEDMGNIKLEFFTGDFIICLHSKFKWMPLLTQFLLILQSAQHWTQELLSAELEYIVTVPETTGPVLFCRLVSNKPLKL